MGFEMDDLVVWVFGIACLLLVVIGEPFMNRLDKRDYIGLRILVWGLTLTGVGGIIAICSGWKPPPVLILPILLSIAAVIALRCLHANDPGREELPT